MSERIPFPEDAGTLGKKPCGDEPGFSFTYPGRQSGRWKCKLSTRAPLCLKSHFEAYAQRGENHVEIPGSSIRGMVRNAAEMLGAGCGRFYENPPPGVPPCTPAAACIVCRVFGFIQQPPDPFCWTSRVRFHDSKRKTVVWERYNVVGAHRPATDHNPGWIVFPSGDFSLPQVAGGIPCVPAYTDFDFDVDFTNLDSEELALLQFALTLKFDMYQLHHMLGYTKALGFGRCQVVVGEPLPPLASDLSFIDQEALDKLYQWRPD